MQPKFKFHQRVRVYGMPGVIVDAIKLARSEESDDEILYTVALESPHAFTSLFDDDPKATLDVWECDVVDARPLHEVILTIVEVLRVEALRKVKEFAPACSRLVNDDEPEFLLQMIDRQGPALLKAHVMLRLTGELLVHGEQTPEKLILLLVDILTREKVTVSSTIGCHYDTARDEQISRLDREARQAFIDAFKDISGLAT